MQKDAKMRQMDTPGSRSTTAYTETYFVLPYSGVAAIWSSDLNTPSNSPVISEIKRCLDRYMTVQMSGFG